ncbi:MAG: hypothetical protein OEU54_01735 [Gemmatimonadota bacterium]|nr:hypothetical protein [Gemmatimonadota bacterium]
MSASNQTIVRRRMGFPRGVGAVWRLLTMLGTVVLAGACATTPTDPAGEDLRMVLAVSGGIAGVDWQVTIDALTGRVTGDRCRTNLGCDWGEGEILASVTPAQVRSLADEFQGSGFFEGETEYGTECCDQFDFRLSFGENDFDRTVTGSSGRLPSDILDLITLVQEFVDDVRD